ncbi:NfeD family protein [Dehalogenimonas etheniformans]|uniref:NfeD-like C-terminal domain-containing protein n=1 Tax=Dehalogenimonas etheniformans TaxID=1536648 RepID=A0A2P5P4Q6_9CHLR|nr:NfeD family protein [Dehalogenimonas etheniformans]PPD57282.1 hypothetical protein JP09_009535 [Dehalogenimonas etheniformans]QNT76998.1 NfeD family protein [Dehalogenimonas etheniformans]
MYIFLAIGIIGFIILLVSFIFGEITDFAQDTIGDVTGNEVGHGPGPFSLRSIAAFTTGFGFVGYIFSELGWDPLQAALPGLLFGALMSLLSIVLVKALIKQQASGSFGLSELVGKPVDISTPIPQGGVGAVTLVFKESSQTFIARTKDGSPLEAGAPAKITNFQGRTAIVEKI